MEAMEHSIPTSQPFSFAQTLTFIERFPPCLGRVKIAGKTLRAAVTVQRQAVAFALRDEDGLVVEVADTIPPSIQREVVARAASFVGATDDVAAFYAAAETDAPFARLLPVLHGLHHVRFLSLAEIAVYS